ncbi:probable glycosyltransferase At3g07620 [Phoenix dactylifera]|uniref:Probable glycosyltransferase At3g07620 n=1 Tax=Phoenix dactylifera TaxID=42345 RepID=A0A8B7C1N1_PHODC|nr:probable glycosyltransferase At3g07620 [Phoenix dactylifera]
MSSSSGSSSFLSAPMSRSFVPKGLTLLTSILLLVYISSTSNYFLHLRNNLLLLTSSLGSAPFPPRIHPDPPSLARNASNGGVSDVPRSPGSKKAPPFLWDGSGLEGRIDRSSRSRQQFGSKGKGFNNQVFHDKYIFTEDYKEMNRSFKVFVYPHSKEHPFAHAFLPVDFEPGGNYASESYFKKALIQSHFITKDPLEADLFFLPFSIARLRHDPRVGVGGISEFIRNYITDIRQNYPYWNQSGGANHFYVACHSIGRSAMARAEEVRLNAIQVVCSSSYFLSGYVAHKDASLPQIWPRHGTPPNVFSSKRARLAFFSGSVNSPVRKRLMEAWGNDSEILVHSGHITTPYEEGLLNSKFCLHVKGFEVNTARIGDAIYFGCVPVIIANHYDLPFADILNWKSFSLVVATLDIPLLKKILHDVRPGQYEMLQKNVLKVRKHFQWHSHLPVDYDAFYMVMYELWLRRSAIKFSVSWTSETCSHNSSTVNCT